jgi:hypothetical protein
VKLSKMWIRVRLPSPVTGSIRCRCSAHQPRDEIRNHYRRVNDADWAITGFTRARSNSRFIASSWATLSKLLDAPKHLDSYVDPPAEFPLAFEPVPARLMSSHVEPINTALRGVQLVRISS